MLAYEMTTYYLQNSLKYFYYSYYAFLLLQLSRLSNREKFLKYLDLFPSHKMLLSGWVMSKRMTVCWSQEWRSINAMQFLHSL